MTTRKGNIIQQMEQERRNHFTFFRSFQEAIDQCDEEDQLPLYRGIVNYALDGKEPVFDNPMLKLAWTLIRPNLGKGLRNWKNGCNGGAPAGNQNARKTTEKQPKNNRKTTEKQRDRIGKDRIGMEEDNVSIETKEDIEERTAEPSVPLSPEYSNFLEWLNSNCPHLLGMEIPTEQEYKKLLEIADGSKKVLTDKLLAMENNKSVPKDKRSIYETCKEWLYRDLRDK